MSTTQRAALKRVAAFTFAMLLTILGLSTTPASAAASHENTNPHTTGCNKGAYTIGSKAVSGGTAYIWVSPSCATNWVSYSGTNQKTIKKGKADGKAWTRTETDTAASSWSMQSYAPGTTKYTGVITIGATTYTANCSNGCTWTTTTTSTTTLSSKVDAFTTKWLGKYADFDGYYGAQCVDLFNFYNRDVVGAKRPAVAYAYQLATTYDQAKYTFVSASSAPKKGDVAVWKSSYPNGSGGAGHVAIVLSVSGDKFTALTQNPGAAQKVTYTKSHIAGFLRPKG